MSCTHFHLDVLDIVRNPLFLLRLPSQWKSALVFRHRYIAGFLGTRCTSDRRMHMFAETKVSTSENCKIIMQDTQTGHLQSFSHTVTVCRPAVIKKNENHLCDTKNEHKRTKSILRTAVCLLVGCLTSQQHASVSQGRICTDNFTCCHTEIEVADPTFYLTQSQYTDTGPTSPSADPITPGAWQCSHWSANS